MKKQFIFLILCFVLIFGLTAFLTAKATDSPPVCTSYAYSNWSSCDPSGSQERTQTASYPNGCVIDFTSTTLVPITRQKCTYVPPVPFCTSYTYSNWSSCDPNLGSQERINTASFPAGCVIDFSGNNPAPITRQRCTYVPPVPQSVSQPPQPQQSIVPPAAPSVSQPPQPQWPTQHPSAAFPAQDASSTITSSTPQSSPLMQSLIDQIKILQKQVSELQSSQSDKHPSVSGNAPSDANSAVNACVIIANNLTYRSRDVFTNGDVSALQDFLQAKGYLATEPSGFFGLLTLQAVKDFQADNNINPTGYVGSITRGKIQQLTCK